MPRIENWSVTDNSDGYKSPELIRKFLVGKVYGHSDPKQYDGKEIRTSYLVELDIEGKTARTRNTEYELGELDPGYAAYLAERKETK